MKKLAVFLCAAALCCVMPMQAQAQDYSHFPVVTDAQESTRIAAQMDAFAGVPTFSSIANIDRSWVAKQLFWQVDADDASSAEVERYQNTMLSARSDIEALAKRQINPAITMPAAGAYPGCDGSSIAAPLWIPEKDAFAWDPVGGFQSEVRSYPLVMRCEGARYYVKSIDILLTYAEEYFPEAGSCGTFSARPAAGGGWEDIGTFTQEGNSMRYTLRKNLGEVEQSWYVLEKGADGALYLCAKQPVGGVSAATFAGTYTFRHAIAAADARQFASHADDPAGTQYFYQGSFTCTPQGENALAFVGNVSDDVSMHVGEIEGIAYQTAPNSFRFTGNDAFLELHFAHGELTVAESSAFPYHGARVTFAHTYAKDKSTSAADNSQAESLMKIMGGPAISSNVVGAISNLSLYAATSCHVRQVLHAVCN